MAARINNSLPCWPKQGDHLHSHRMEILVAFPKLPQGRIERMVEFLKALKLFSVRSHGQGHLQHACGAPVLGHTITKLFESHGAASVLVHEGEEPGRVED